MCWCVWLYPEKKLCRQRPTTSSCLWRCLICFWPRWWCPGASIWRSVFMSLSTHTGHTLCIVHINTDSSSNVSVCVRLWVNGGSVGFTVMFCSLWMWWCAPPASWIYVPSASTGDVSSLLIDIHLLTELFSLTLKQQCEILQELFCWFWVFLNVSPH